MKRNKSQRPLDHFPYSEVGVSYFAEQAYCEKRVELWLQNPTMSGVISVPAKLEGLPETQIQEDLISNGKEFHEAVGTAATPLSPSEIAQAVQLGRSFALSESRLTGEYQGVRLRGRPDHVFFDGQQASCVLEYKITDSNQLQTSHRVQLLLYGYLLGQQNFNVDHLILVCVLIPRHHETWLAKLTPSRVRKFVTTIRTEAESLIAARPSRKNWQMRVEVSPDVHVTLRVFRYDPQRAKRELDFFTAYWLGSRDAVGTRKENKCAVCQYNRLKLCPVPQVEYGG
jgi:hypothetical protein